MSQQTTPLLTLASVRFKQIRLGIQGAPNTGKTTAALTAPNPVVADFDNKLSLTNAVANGVDPETVKIIPFYNPEFVDKIKPRANPRFAPNKRDAFTIWLINEGTKLTAEQTLIIDSWTMLQAAFDQQTGYEPATSRNGAEDKFVFWARKIEYAKELCERLKSLACHVIVTFHETVDRDDEGKPTGKVKLVMQGQFADQLAGHFTDWFRQHALAKLADPSNPRSAVIGSDYQWQTTSDNVCNCGTHLIGIKPKVPANWNVFVNPSKYKIS